MSLLKRLTGISSEGSATGSGPSSTSAYKGFAETQAALNEMMLTMRADIAAANAKLDEASFLKSYSDKKKVLNLGQVLVMSPVTADWLRAKHRYYPEWCRVIDGFTDFVITVAHR